MQQVRYPDLAGKIAVITGGSRGIGAFTAHALAANEVGVVLVGRDEQALARTSAAIRRDGGKALGVCADCTLEAEVECFAETVNEHFGPVDIIAAFAGGNGRPVASAQETAGHWREVLESDLTSAFLTIRAFLPGMVDRGRGSIIAMSSAAARAPAQSNAAYAAAKGGVIAFSRHLASELAPAGIRVNCIAPAAGWRTTSHAETPLSAKQRYVLGSSFPLGRIGRPADVASASTVPGLRRLLVDNGHHPRHRGRKGHDLSRRILQGDDEGNDAR